MKCVSCEIIPFGRNSIQNVSHFPPVCWDCRLELERMDTLYLVSASIGKQNKKRISIYVCWTQNNTGVSLDKYARWHLWRQRLKNVDTRLQHIIIEFHLLILLNTLIPLRHDSIFAQFQSFSLSKCWPLTKVPHFFLSDLWNYTIFQIFHFH